MKERLDVLLVKRNLAKSRELAKSFIKAGNVFVENRCEQKASTQVEEDALIEIKGETLKYVSRGGLKLEKAIIEFNLDLHHKVCMDIGASTGGFTDCMLQNGADKVFAIDVGTDQLDDTLRQDKRVISMEQMNVRNLTREMLGEKIDFVSVDVSFISLTKVLPVISVLVENGTELVCLIKPQFEAGKQYLNKKGVIKDKKIQTNVIEHIITFSKELEFVPLGLSYSPIKGPEGNVEFLLWLTKQSASESVMEKEQVQMQASSMNRKAYGSDLRFGIDIQRVVLQAHGDLDAL